MYFSKYRFVADVMIAFGNHNFWRKLIVAYTAADVLLVQMYYWFRFFTGADVLLVQMFYWGRCVTGTDVLLVQKCY